MKKWIALLVALLLLLGLWLVLRKGPTPPTKKDPATQTVKKKVSIPLRKVLSQVEPVQQDADAIGTLVLEGQVLAPNSTPAPGAIVWLDTQPPRSVTTDEHGWFSFEGLTGRPYQVSARKDEASVGPLSLRLTEESGPIILQLVRGSDLLLKVVDEEQRPIQNAAVEILSMNALQQRTNVEGEARFVGVGSGRLIIKASAEGFGAARVEVFSLGTPNTTQEYQVTLEHGAALSGVVQDTQGNPIEGATVGVVKASGLLFYSLGHEEALTDAQGRFSFDAISAGSYRLRATHPSFAPFTSSTITLDGAVSRSDIVLTLEKGGLVAGTVVTSDGQPVPFALVRFVFHKEPSLKSTRQLYCDEQGRFEADGLPRTEIGLVASSESATSEYFFADLATQNEQRDIEIVLDNDGSISGTVVFSGGGPAANVVVRVINRRGVLELPKHTPSTITDPDGRFVLTGLGKGKHLIQAVPPGTPRQSLFEFRTSETASQKEFEAGVTDAVLTLEESVTMKGRVIFEEGGTPEQFTIRTADDLDGTPFMKTNGDFVLTDLEPAESTYMEVSGPSFETLEVKEIKLIAGEVKDVGVLKVKKGNTIRGTVKTEDGRPVSGARVVIADDINGGLYKLFGIDRDYEEGKETYSKSDGTFVLDGMPSESLGIIARHPVHGSSKPRTIQGPAEVELVLTAFASIEGTIVRGDKPIQALLGLESKEDDDFEWMTTSEADGSFRFERLPAGEYELSYGDSYRMTLVVVVLDDETITKEVSLQAGETLSLALSIPALPVLLLRATLNGEPTSASFYLIQAGLTPATRGELAVLASEEGVVREAPGGGFFTPPSQLPEHTAVLPSVAPGEYQVCVVPGRAWLSKEDKEPVFCQRVTVSDKEIQEISIALKP